jgi:hypothetical protein
LTARAIPDAEAAPKTWESSNASHQMGMTGILEPHGGRVAEA